MLALRNLDKVRAAFEFRGDVHHRLLGEFAPRARQRQLNFLLLAVDAHKVRTSVCAVFGPVVVVAVTDKVIARLRNNHRQANLAVFVVDVGAELAVRRLGTARNIHMRQGSVFRLGAQVTPEERLPQFRPSVVGIDDIADLDVGISAIVLVVVMIHKALAVHVLERFAARRPVVAPVTTQQDCATAIQQFLARLVDIAARNRLGAPHRRLVRIVLEVRALLAAVIPRRKQVVIAVMLDKACALDSRTATVRDVDHLCTVFHLACFFVQFQNMDARAPRTECHPDLTIVVLQHCRVNRVVRIALDRVNHLAHVRPAIIRLGRVNFLARHEAHARRANAHLGTAIVHAVLAANVMDIRRPDVNHVRRVLVKPPRKFRHGGLAILPVQRIFGKLHEHVVVRRRERVAVLVTDNIRVMPRPAGLLRVPISRKSLPRHQCRKCKNHVDSFHNASLSHTAF